MSKRTIAKESAEFQWNRLSSIILNASYNQKNEALSTWKQRKSKGIKYMPTNDDKSIIMGLIEKMLACCQLIILRFIFFSCSSIQAIRVHYLCGSVITSADKRWRPLAKH